MTLAEQNIDVAEIAASRYAKKYGGTREEYLSAAYLGLVDAERTYRAELAAYRTHAYRRACGRISEETRKERGRRVKNGLGAVHVSMDAPVGKDGATVGDFISAKPIPDSVESEDSVEFIIKQFNTLFRQDKVKRKCATAFRLIADGLSNVEACEKAGWGRDGLASVIHKHKKIRKAVA